MSDFQHFLFNTCKIIIGLIFKNLFLAYIYFKLNYILILLIDEFVDCSTIFDVITSYLILKYVFRLQISKNCNG